ncbi:MAG: hypothetical protein IT462_10855 [Planctomycetes bacterium]|nr:hypothetical protein [Planctomycetota bacterium]
MPRMFFAFSLMVVLSVAAANLGAAIWDGSAGDNNWSTAANWDTNDAPDTAGETAIFNAAVPSATVTNVPGGATIDMIQVDFAGSGAVTLTLTGTLTLAGSGFDSILVGAGDTLNFVSGGTPRTLAIEDNTTVAGGGTLSFDSNVTVLMQGSNFPDINIGVGSTFNCLGAFRVNTANTTVIDADNTAGATVITFNDIQVDTTLEWDISGTADVDISINGDLRAGANNAYFGMNNMLTGGSLVYNIAMAGDFTANNFTLFEVQADYGFWDFTATSHNFFTGGAGTYETAYFGQMNIPVGATVTVTDNAFDAPTDRRLAIYQLFVDGAFAAGNNELDFYGTVFFDADSTVIDVDALASFTQTGDVFFNCVDNFTTSIAGVVTFDGDVNIGGGAAVVVVVAAFGSTITFNGDLWIENSPFGAVEDGGNPSPLPPILNYNGNVRVDEPDGLLLGEGIHNFLGNLDLGATAAQADVVNLPSATNDFLFEVHLIAGSGTAPSQVLDFEPVTGSFFAVTSVATQAQVEQNGRMALGFMDLTAATIGGTVWDGAGGSIELGGRVEGDFEIVTGSMDVIFGDVVLIEVAAPTSATAGGMYTFWSSNGGTFDLANLTVGGDVSDDFGAGETNGGAVWFLESMVAIAGDILVLDGDNGGDGGFLHFSDCTVSADNVLVGDDVAASAVEGADFELSDNTALLLLTLLDVAPFASLRGSFAAIDSFDNLAYTISVDAAAAETMLMNCFVSCHTTADVTVNLGGSSVTLVGTTFEYYSPAGVTINAGSTIAAFNGCTFRNGVSLGSHVTLLGLANVAKINCDENLFDATTGSATDALIDATGNNRLNFRCLATLDFGLGSVILDAAGAEALDNDGVTADNVTWEAVPNQLTLAESGSQPLGVISDTAAHQTVFLFTLTAVGASTTVTQMSFEFEMGGDLIASDIANATLYEDLNFDGAYDLGEGFTGTIGIAVAAGSVTFTVPSEVVAAGTTVTWGLGVTFNVGAAGLTGSVRAFVDPVTGVVISSPATTIVSGLPLVGLAIPVTGTVAALVFLIQPSTEQAGVPITPVVVVELHDAEGNIVLGRSFNVNASIQSGGAVGAVLSGPLTVASNVGTGTATFAGLSINLEGTGYVLRFSISSPAVFVDSAAFDITPFVAPPPTDNGKKQKDDGGCAAQGPAGAPLAAIAALLAVIGLATVARLRRE